MVESARVDIAKGLTTIEKIRFGSVVESGAKRRGSQGKKCVSNANWNWDNEHDDVDATQYKCLFKKAGSSSSCYA